ncbi:MAG: hypothetical protein O0V67_07185 [Methanocorpusculum sp.]|nr:hypothetical protein [Methanocorpusculum sp.]
MKDFGRQRSTVRPDEMVIDEFSVWIHSDIQEVSEPGIDDQEGFTGYEFNMVQYDKDEFIMQQAKMNSETNKILNTMLGVNE